MNADDKGGGIQWMASRLGKLPAEITSLLDGEPGIDDARVKEEDPRRVECSLLLNSV